VVALARKKQYQIQVIGTGEKELSDLLFELLIRGWEQRPWTDEKERGEPEGNPFPEEDGEWE